MLAVALGSRTVEMLTILSLIIHGPTVSRLAKVGSVENESYVMYYGGYPGIETDCVGGYHTCRFDYVNATTLG